MADYKYNNNIWEISPTKPFQWNNVTKFYYRNIINERHKLNVNVLVNEDNVMVLPLMHKYPKIFVNLINKLNKEQFTLKEDVDNATD